MGVGAIASCGSFDGMSIEHGAGSYFHGSWLKVLERSSNAPPSAGFNTIFLSPLIKDPSRPVLKLSEINKYVENIFDSCRLL